MSHVHGGHEGGGRVEWSAVRNALAVATAVIALLTVAGAVVLWPRGDAVDIRGLFGADAQFYDGHIEVVDVLPCTGAGDDPRFACAVFDIRLKEGPDKGEIVTHEQSIEESAPPFDEGDDVVVAAFENADGGLTYTLADFQRRQPLLLLAALFALVTVLLGRWRGVRALAGLGVSLVVLLVFVLPALLDGRSAIGVALVGASAIMLVAIHLVHGFDARASVAVLGTMASLALTGALAVIFVGFTELSGLGTEDAAYLQVSAAQVNLRGLLLGGVIIGALGVLDDVTVTQVSAVWEVHHANPSLPAVDLYRSGLRVGRDHIASTVNTLVLAYAGASLPALILFEQSNRSLTDVATSEVLAVEIVRTLVGSIGLVAAVPVTTALAAFVVTRRPKSPPATAGAAMIAAVKPTDHADAARIATEAGRLLVERRATADPGTGARGDREANELILRLLADAHPGDAVLSEESVDDPARLDAPRVWIVDPLDGTREYGEEARTDWAVHVALWVRGAAGGDLAAGAVALPALGATLTTADPPPLPVPNLTAPRLVVSRTRPPAVTEAIQAALGAELVPMGSAGAKAMAVVRGEADVYAHAGGQYEWDSAAPVAVARAAGLHVSRLDGSPLVYNQANPWLPDLLICHAELADRVIAAAREAGIS